MRERFVWQVLGATLGCGLLLALIGVVQVPNDASQPVMATPAAIASPLPAQPAGAEKKAVPSPGGADFSDECQFPSCDTTEKAPPPPKHDCA